MPKNVYKNAEADDIYFENEEYEYPKDTVVQDDLGGDQVIYSDSENFNMFDLGGIDLPEPKEEEAVYEMSEPEDENMENEEESEEKVDLWINLSSAAYSYMEHIEDVLDTLIEDGADYERFERYAMNCFETQKFVLQAAANREIKDVISTYLEDGETAKVDLKDTDRAFVSEWIAKFEEKACGEGFSSPDEMKDSFLDGLTAHAAAIERTANDLLVGQLEELGFEVDYGQNGDARKEAEPAPDQEPGQAVHEDDPLADFLSDEEPVSGTTEYTMNQDLKQPVPGIEGVLEDRNMSDTEKVLYLKMNEALFRSIREIEAGDVVGEDKSAGVAKIISIDIRQDPELKAAFVSYANEKNIFGSDKIITGIEFLSRRKWDDKEVNDCSFRIVIDEKDRSKRVRATEGHTGTAQKEKINLFTSDERKEWAENINAAGRAVLEGKRPNDILFSGREDGFGSLYDRLTYSYIHSPSMDKSEEQKEQNVGKEGFESTEEENREEFEKKTHSSGKEKTVSFRVLDHNGRFQQIKATVDKDNHSIGLFVNRTEFRPGITNYELRFKGSPHPVFETNKLFTPMEAAYLSNTAKDAIAKSVAQNTADAINRYYSDDSENRFSQISAPATARDYKTAALMELMPPGSDERKAFERAEADNREKARGMMNLLGFRYGQENWKCNIVMAATSARNQETRGRIPVIQIEDVGKDSSRILAKYAAGYGLKCEYDASNGVFSMWQQKNPIEVPKIDDWRTISFPTDVEYNKAVLEYAGIRIQADRAGQSIDAERHIPVSDEQDIYRMARKIVVGEPETVLQYERKIDDRTNARLAECYLRSMGIALGERANRDSHDYGLSVIRPNTSRIYQAPLIGDDTQMALLVVIGGISEKRFEEVRAQMDISGIHYSYERDTGTLSVSMSKEGRPAFERVGTYREPSVEQIKMQYMKNASQTIGAMEAKHIYEHGDYMSKRIRNSVFCGYKELTAEEKREMGASRKDVKKERQDTGRDAARGFFTREFEQAVTKERDTVLDRADFLSKDVQSFMGKDR